MEFIVTPVKIITTNSHFLNLCLPKRGEQLSKNSILNPAGVYCRGQWQLVDSGLMAHVEAPHPVLTVPNN